MADGVSFSNQFGYKIIFMILPVKVSCSSIRLRCVLRSRYSLVRGYKPRSYIPLPGLRVGINPTPCIACIAGDKPVPLHAMVIIQRRDGVSP